MHREFQPRESEVLSASVVDNQNRIGGFDVVSPPASGTLQFNNSCQRHYAAFLTVP